jgi:predicted TIM-barrel fold metal-dependent hydrolase
MREARQPIKFDNLLDLARLPYFEVSEGRLKLADPALGPVIDCHTHLALAYGPRPAKIDLMRETPNVELYLRNDKAIDFEPYMNRNFAPHDLHAVERDMTRDSFGAGGMRATHTLPNLLKHMSDVGVTQSILLPVDFPFWSKNSESWLALTKQKGEIICFGSVHPYEPRLRRQVKKLAEMGARGLKFHPAVQMVGPDDRRAMKLYRLCAEYKLPILFHCGPVDIETRVGRRLCQVKRYERAIAENPDVDFVLGHAGALQMEEAIVYAQKYPNVYYEIASQSLPAVERLVDDLPEGRLMMGSDWPFYHPAIGIAKVLIATERAIKARRAVLHDNAARLFRMEPLTATANGRSNRGWAGSEPTRTSSAR